MSGGTFGTNWLDLSNTATTNFLIRSYVQGFVDISGGNLILRNNNFYMTGGDASINGRVLVTGDVSMGGRLYVQGASTFQTAPIMSGANITTGTIPASAIAGGVQTNGMDLSTNQTVNGVKTFGNILTASAGIVSFTDASFNTRLFVGGDASFNGNVFIKGGLTVQQLQNQNIINTTTTNYQLIVSEDISLNGRLFVSGDVSMNSRMYVGGTSIHVGDASFNNRVLVGSDVSLGGRLYVPSNSSLIIGGVPFTGGTVFTGGAVANDISLNTRLFVGGDVSINSRMYVGGTSIHVGDASFNNRVLVGGDASFGGRLYVPSNSSLIIGGVPFTGGTVFTGGSVANDISLNTRLFVGGDVSINNKLFVGGDVSINGILSSVGCQTNKILPSLSIPTIAVSGLSVTTIYSQATCNSGYGYVSTNAGLYRTSNYGETWTLVNNTIGAVSPSQAIPQVLFADSTGQYVQVGTGGNNMTISISTNYGVTFTGVTAWSGTFWTQDGAGFFMNGAYGYVYWSQARTAAAYSTTNYGQTWTLVTTPPAAILNGYGTFGITDNGAKYLKFARNVGTLYTSTDYGNTWTSAAATNGGTSIGISSDGKYIVSNSSGAVNVSSNYGTSFTTVTLTNATANISDLIYVSSDGSVMTIPNYYSTNFGVTWTYYTTQALYITKNLSYALGISGANVKYSVSTIKYNANFIGSIIVSDDSSFNGRVLVGSDVSLGGRLYVPSNSSLIIGGVPFTGTFNGGTVANDISLNSKLFVGGDVSMNSRLFVSGNVGIGITSPNYTLDVSGGAEFTQDISMGGRLFVRGDVSMNSRLYVAGTSNLIGDASFNNRILVGGDASFGGRIFLPANSVADSALSTNIATLTGSQTLTNKTITTSGLLTVGAGLVTTVGDASFNNRVLVGSDVSLGGRLYVAGNTELSGNLLIKGGLTVQQLQNQNIINTTTTNYQLIVSEDISLNGRFFVSGDTSLNSRLYVAGTSNLIGDASFNNKVFVGGDVSINSRLFVSGNVGIGTTSPNYTLDVSGGAEFTQDISMGGRLFVGGDVSLNSRLYVAGTSIHVGDASFNNRILVGGDASFGGRIFLPAGSIADSALSTNIVTLTGGQILTNKTLTAPTITSITNSGTITVPSGTDTLVGRNTTDTLTNKTITTSGLLTVGAGLVTTAGDASFNNRILVGGDASFGGRIFLPANSVADSALSTNIVTLTGGQTLTNKTITTTGLLTVGAGLVMTAGDASLNNRVFIGSDVSMGSRLYVQGDVSINGNLLIKGGLTVQQLQNQNIINTTTTNYQLIVSEDISLNGRLFASGDASFNGNVSINGNLTAKYSPGAIPGYAINGQFGINNAGLALVTGDVSFNGNVTVGQNLAIGKANAQYSIDTPGIASCGAVFQFDAASGVNTLNTSMVGGVYNSQILNANAGLTVPLGQTTTLSGPVSTNAITMNGPATMTGGFVVTTGNATITSGNLTIGSAGLFVNGNTALSGITTLGNTAVFLTDASINGRLLIGGDISYNRGVNIFGNLTIGSVSAGSGYAIAPLDIRPTGVITNITTGTTLASFSGITSSNIPLTSNRVNMNLSSFIDSNGLPTNSISAIDDGAGSGSLIFSSKTGYGTGSVAMTECMRITSSGQVGIGTFIAGTNNIAPNYALDINGNTNIRNNLNIQGNIFIPSSGGIHTINGNLTTGATQFTGQATFLSGLNYQVGTAITTTTTLTTPLAQFYTVNCGTAYTITLPAPATVTKGQYFSFKRVTTAAGIITITSPTASAIIPYNSITGATSITIPTTNFSTGFICDGTNYYQLTLA